LTRVYTEDELVPLSALQHMAFCERQCALIHIEQQWAENRLTVEGELLHERVHSAESEGRAGIVVARGLRIQSRRLGLSGQADVVEFRACGGAEERGAMQVAGRAGFWRVFPVEYKRGRPKPDRRDEVQLCAQALCLEEMLGAEIAEGAIFYGQPRRRWAVAFGAGLRGETEELAGRVHALLASGKTPAAVYEKKCRNCSLIGICMPAMPVRAGQVARYVERQLRDAAEE
jgi:CRISPR-associated exonuclease Cas4